MRKEDCSRSSGSLYTHFIFDNIRRNPLYSDHKKRSSYHLTDRHPAYDREDQHLPGCYGCKAGSDISDDLMFIGIPPAEMPLVGQGLGEKDIMGTGMKEVSIRQGRPSDAHALVQLLASQRMGTDIDPSDFMVAEVNCRLLGAARLEWTRTDDAFLRPIVVATEAQGTGLGRALLERLFGVCSRISVVARGDAVPFYRHLGFRVMDWSSVPSPYRDECECCGDFAQCRPMLMRWTLKQEGPCFCL
jgi:N-acetylglutamate synthase-like GNAT family acetyltransferase